MHGKMFLVAGKFQFFLEVKRPKTKTEIAEFGSFLYKKKAIHVFHSIELYSGVIVFLNSILPPTLSGVWARSVFIFFAVNLETALF